MSPTEVRLLNHQEPPVGASALQNHQVAAMAQFVPWPQLMVFRKQGRLLYDGGSPHGDRGHATAG